jgi:predicted TIM-barrel fold metal-dependent hydrolase
MKQPYSILIDSYSHIVPPKYLEARRKIAPRVEGDLGTRGLYDLDLRFRVMDKFEGMVQVLTMDIPPVEDFGEHSVDLAKIANDEMAELVTKYPDRFVSAIASLPMNNMDAALKEVDRAINDLKFRGVLIYSNINDKPLDSPEFMPLYEKMSHYNLPIFIHPHRDADFPDYKTEKTSKYNIQSVFGWPYETTAAMTRLVFSGILEKFPNLKIVTHHCGGMVSFYAERIIQHHDKYESGRTGGYKRGLTKAPIDYFKMFYNDTAIHGNPAALMCAYDFWGADRMLFAADIPHADRQHGLVTTRKTISAIEQMQISDIEKKKIFEDNARNLMRLPV